MNKKFRILLITIAGLMLIGASCTSQQNIDEPLIEETENIENEDIEEVGDNITLHGEIVEEDTQPRSIIGEVDPINGSVSTNNNIEIGLENDSQLRVFNMIASQYKFEPNTIKVKQGNKVVINITSSDVEHGFAIDGYGLRVSVPAGETKTVEFTANKTGRFNFYCSVYCGSGHSAMNGVLIVE